MVQCLFRGLKMSQHSWGSPKAKSLGIYRSFCAYRNKSKRFTFIYCEKTTLWITKVLGHSSGLWGSQSGQEQGSKPQSSVVNLKEFSPIADAFLLKILITVSPNFLIDFFLTLLWKIQVYWSFWESIWRETVRKGMLVKQRQIITSHAVEIWKVPSLLPSWLPLLTGM